MSELGLTPGMSGNVSVRSPAGMIVTPSGMPYSELRPDDAVELKLAAEVETLASQYWHAAQVGSPHVLDRDELLKVRDKFAEYGQRRRR